MPLSMRDFLLVMMVTILWGLHAPIMKLGIGEADAFTLCFIRFFLTGLIFLPFAGKISWDDIKRLIPVSVFFVCVSLMFGQLSVNYINGNSFVVLIQVAQPITLILAWLLLGEKFGLYTAIGIAIAFCGLLVVFGAPDITSAPLGGVLAVTAAIGWSIGSLSMKKTGHIKPAAFLAYAYLMAAPIALITTYFLESGQIERIMSADLVNLGFVVFYQVIVMASMTFVWGGLIARNHAQYVTPFLMLQPIFAVIGGYFINQEMLNWNVLVGGLITLAGVGFINWRLIAKKKIKA